MACGILVPWPGIKPAPPAMEVQSPNHWTTREFTQWKRFKGVFQEWLIVPNTTQGKYKQKLVHLTSNHKVTGDVGE